MATGASPKLQSSLRAISPPPTRKRKREASDASDADNRPPPHQWLRIYAWNVNGIAPFIQPAITTFFKPPGSPASTSASASTASLRSFLRRHQWPQLLLLQEVKINPSDIQSQRAVERAVNAEKGADKGKSDDGPQYVVKFCLPRDLHNARGFGRKVYGVATIIRKDFFEAEVSNVHTVDWDLEGRVLVVETKFELSIWNIYAVNGTMNDYKSPETGVVVGTRHDRKLAFHQLLMNDCKELEAKGIRVVLAGDMNVAPASIDGFPNLRIRPEQHVKNRTDYNAKFFTSDAGLRAIDSFRYLHPEVRKYTWISRSGEWASSCDRVDHIVLSRNIVEGHSSAHGALKEADILMSAAERGLSDHVPHFVSLDMDVLKDVRRATGQQATERV